LKYSIIIPIYNEYRNISNLLGYLKDYSESKHEILIIDDGSDDGTEIVLKKCSFIKLIRLNKNMGKGYALRKGLKIASNNKIIIFDGDMELNPKDIQKLMILKKDQNIYCVFGARIKSASPFSSIWDSGNFIFTKFFNILYKTDMIDCLCCAKAFYKSDLDTKKLTSSKFDIDIEITIALTKVRRSINNIYIPYKRRSIKKGKKLNLYDGINILKCIVNNR
tara:strand:+ start:357 stop:1019 length:663 start_codon:yes stop_codon:yes gene_type:complete